MSTHPNRMQLKNTRSLLLPPPGLATVITGLDQLRSHSSLGPVTVSYHPFLPMKPERPHHTSEDPASAQNPTVAPTSPWSLGQILSVMSQGRPELALCSLPSLASFPAPPGSLLCPRWFSSVQGLCAPPPLPSLTFCPTFFSFIFPPQKSSFPTNNGCLWSFSGAEVCLCLS